MADKKILLAKMDPEVVTREIEDFILEKVFEHGYTGGVIGLSGGVDSTVAAALAKSAFDKFAYGDGERWDKKSLPELVGYILPSDTNHKKDTEDGVRIAEKLGIRYEVQNIEPIVEAFQCTNPEALKTNYHKGNLMSRIRANILHTKSATENKIVIGTGNWNEDFVLNYYTLFGDGAVHISPIGNLPKRLVKQLAIYHGFNETAAREPTAGLEPNQTDFRDLGYDYDTAELVARGLIQGFSKNEIALDYRVSKAVQNDIARYEKIFGQKKFVSPYPIIEDIAMRQIKAKKKSDLLHPPAARITLDYR